MKILITGTNGYIGKSLYNALKDEHEVIGLTRKNFDLTDFQAMSDFFQNKYFDVVIHCAVVGGSRLKQDSSYDMDINLAMYYNLLQHKPYYAKLIHFGSGAELFSKDTPYGLSKYIIRESILGQDNFYNLRIFGVFDENELDTRFIKANIKNYIKNQPIQIFKDKKMDFFFMEDLVTLVKYFIFNNNLPKEIDCTYNNTSTLLDISQMINNLGNYKVPIIFDNQTDDKSYFGKFIDLNLNYIGLEQGVKNVYNKLKNEY
jgi:GDP-L-fucose synthase